MESLPHIDNTPESEREWHQALINLARYLRSPEGCPWDQKQTALSFARYHVEEGRDTSRLEHGDANHARESAATPSSPCSPASPPPKRKDSSPSKACCNAPMKMVRRHDHVFGETRAATPEEAINAWNQAKARTPPT